MLLGASRPVHQKFLLEFKKNRSGVICVGGNVQMRKPSPGPKARNPLFLYGMRKGTRGARRMERVSQKMWEGGSATLIPEELKRDIKVDNVSPLQLYSR